MCVMNAMLGVAIARQACRRGGIIFSKLQAASPHKNIYNSRQIYSSASSLISRDQTSLASKPAKNADEYCMIYKFPYIVFARAVCRLKIYQTAICGLAVPGFGVLAQNEVVSTEMFVASTAIAGLAFVMLFVMGEIFRRTVGHIYYNSRNDTVKVSHLSFWGGRKDIIIPVNDLVPITDTSDIPTDIYVHLLRYSKPKDSLFLFLRFGGVKDTENFSNVLGLLRPEEQITNQRDLES